jgi:hypothetical protein
MHSGVQGPQEEIHLRGACIQPVEDSAFLKKLQRREYSMRIAFARRLLQIPAVLALLLTATLLVQGGCTSAHITSSPSNADIFLSSERQPEWEEHCKTPCLILLHYGSTKIKAQWQDHSLSDIREADIVFPLFQAIEVHFIKPDSAVVLPKQIDFFSPAVQSTLPGPELCQ